MNPATDEKNQRLAKDAYKLVAGIEHLERKLEQAEAAVAACRNFIATEMGWEWFRSEMLENDFTETGESADNARKLGAFLRDLDLGIPGESILNNLACLQMQVSELVDASTPFLKEARRKIDLENTAQASDLYTALRVTVAECRALCRAMKNIGVT